MTVSIAGDSSDDDLDWEEVHVPEDQDQLELELSPPTPRQNIEITLQAPPKKDDVKWVLFTFPFLHLFDRVRNANRKKAAAGLNAQRLLRTTSHKIHTVALLANARIRNKWINDPLLHVSNLLSSLSS